MKKNLITDMGLQLKAKIFITGHIVAESGLHIGGSKASLDIGGVDLNVIKTPKGVPFIPGSSLRGKLRSLLARLEGSLGVTDKDVEKGELSDENIQKSYIREIFVMPGDEGADRKKAENKPQQVTRLLVRDAELDTAHFEALFPEEEVEMDFPYSDVKWENRIDRKTGTAKDPRQLERVPAGARFKFELVYDVYDDNKTSDHLTHLRTAMRLLEGDYLGGQGSRGYGKIKFEFAPVMHKEVADYQQENQPKSYDFQF